MNDDLELYYMPTCPYCRKVMLYMDKNGIAMTMHDITQDRQARSHLETVGGKVQVPCLFIDGDPMYESDDIVAYLAKRFGIDDALTITPEDQERLDDGAACPIF